jgi:ubiquinone/menaquinone biosynthesis C-methylase UbiE
MSDDLGEEVQARAWWDAWSDTFQSEGGHSVAVAFGPGAPEGDDLGLIGDVAGLDAVELGCGGAQFGIALAEQGANVTGVDISDEQLSYARYLAEERGVEMTFVHESVTEMSLPSRGYDLAFAFQWVEDLQACFEEAHRVLRDGGRLVFSIDHPYYSVSGRKPTASAVGWIRHHAKQLRRFVPLGVIPSPR